MLDSYEAKKLFKENKGKVTDLWHFANKNIYLSGMSSNMDKKLGTFRKVISAVKSEELLRREWKEENVKDWGEKKRKK